MPGTEWWVMRLVAAWKRKTVDGQKGNRWVTPDESETPLTAQELMVVNDHVIREDFATIELEPGVPVVVEPIEVFASQMQGYAHMQAEQKRHPKERYCLVMSTPLDKL